MSYRILISLVAFASISITAKIPGLEPNVLSGTSQTELVENGSFSNGSAGWTLQNDFWAGTNLPNYRSAPGYAAGGVDSSGVWKDNAFGKMSQSVTIPNDAVEVTFSFWYNITTEESGSTAYDVISVWLQTDSGGSLIHTLSNVNSTSGVYTRTPEFDLTSYAGQTVELEFLATTDSSLRTVFRIDDVSMIAQVGSPPNAPSNLAALANSDFVSLAWTANSEDEEWFEVQRRVSGTGSWATLATTQAGEGAYLDFDVTHGISYEYRVFANNSFGSSNYSNTVSATIPYPELSAPTLLAPAHQAENISQSPTFKWSAIDSANGYWLIVADAPNKLPTDPTTDSAPHAIISGSTSQTTYTVGDEFDRQGFWETLDSNTTYYWQVQAFEESGGELIRESNFSQQRLFGTEQAGTVPAAPSQLAASVTSDLASLAWNDNSDNENGFVIERRIGTSGLWAEIAETTAGVGAYIDYDIVPGTTYQYRVYAYNSFGDSSYSNTVTAHIPLEEFPAPLLSAPLNGASGISQSPTFEWNPVSGANGYWLIVADAPDKLPSDPSADSAPHAIISGATSQTSYTVGNEFDRQGSWETLDSDTTYYWQVQAFEESGGDLIRESNFSQQRSFTTEEEVEVFEPVPAWVTNTNGIGLRLREEPNLLAEIIRVLPEGEQVLLQSNDPVFFDGYQWLPVDYSSIQGWVAVDFLTVSHDVIGVDPGETPSLDHPDPPVTLSQWDSNGQYALSRGAEISEDSIQFQVDLPDHGESGPMRLQVEVRAANMPFRNSPTHTGPIGEGSLISTTVSKLSSGEYHWQARVMNSQGMSSDWVSYSGEDETIPDFTVNIRHEPVAFFSSSVKSFAISGESIQLSASASGGRINIEEYRWDFGDGSISEGIEVTHTFQSQGVYDVQLTIFAANGTSATYIKSIEVVDRALISALDRLMVHGNAAYDEIIILSERLDAAATYFSRGANELRFRQITEPVLALGGIALGEVDWFDERLQEIAGQLDHKATEEAKKLFSGFVQSTAKGELKRFVTHYVDEAYKNYVENGSDFWTFWVLPLWSTIEHKRNRLESQRDDFLLSTASLSTIEQNQLADLMNEIIGGVLRINDVFRMHAILPVDFQGIKESDENSFSYIFGEKLFSQSTSLLSIALSAKTSGASKYVTQFSEFGITMDTIRRELNTDDHMAMLSLGALKHATSAVLGIAENIQRVFDSVEDPGAIVIPKGEMTVSPTIVLSPRIDIGFLKNVFVEKEGFLEILVTNTGETSAVFSVHGSYMHSYRTKGISIVGREYKMKTPISADPIQLEPGESHIKKLHFVDQGNGEIPLGPIDLQLIAEKDILTLADSTKTQFNTVYIDGASGEEIEYDEIVDAVRIPNPLQIRKRMLPNGREYEIQVNLKNPFGTTMSGRFVQKIPAGLIVKESGSGALNDDRLIFDLDLLEDEDQGVWFTLSRESPDGVVELPAGELSVFDLINEEWHRFESQDMVLVFEGLFEIMFADENLRAAVLGELGFWSGHMITAMDMESIRSLNAKNKGIQRLDGLEHAVNLETLLLDSNQINDLTPLGALIELVDLSLKNNRVFDLSGLEILASIGNLDELSLEGNYLDMSSDLLTKEIVEAFQAGGTNVSVEGQQMLVAPMANAISGDVFERSSVPHTIIVNYLDDIGLDVSTFIENSDAIYVTGPGGFEAFADYVSSDDPVDSSLRAVIYEVWGPGNTWSNQDNGIYSIKLRGGQIGNIAGKFIEDTKIGSFEVNVPPVATWLNWKWKNPLPQGNHLTDFAVGDDFILAVGFQGTVLRSEDGASWDFVDIGMQEAIRAAAAGDGRVMIGGAGYVLSSADGLTWTTVLDEDDRGHSFGIAYGDGIWVAVYDYYNYSENRQDIVVFRSSDGSTWERLELEAVDGRQHVLDVVYGGDGRFLVSLEGIGGMVENKIMISTDFGESWDEVTEAPDVPLYAISRNEGIFVGVGTEGTVAVSLDGFSWEIQYEEAGMFLSDVIFADGTWVVIYPGFAFSDSFARVLISDDTEEWQWFELEGHWEGIRSIAYFKDRFIASGYAGALLSGEVPSKMSGEAAATTDPLSDIAYNGEVYVAVGGGYRWPPSEFSDPNAPKENVIISSPDLEHWTVRETTSEERLYGVAYGNDTFVAVGHQGTVLTSDDGIEWTEQDSGTWKRINAITFGDGYFVAVGHEDYLAVSTNGVNWQRVEVPPQMHNEWWVSDFRDVTYGNGRFVAVASGQHFEQHFGLGQEGRIIYASNPFSWETSPLPNPPVEYEPHHFEGNLVGVIHGTNGFLVFGYNERVDEYMLPLVLHSKNGEKWSYVEVDRGFIPSAICSSPVGYIATGRQSSRGWPVAAYVSPDGINWDQVTSFPSSPPEWIWNMYHHENQLIAVGDHGAVVSVITHFPFITRQPRSISVFEGERIELIVEAIDPLGGDLDYQWFFNDDPIDHDERKSGAQTNVLVVEGMLADDAGNYSVEIANEEGMVSSLDATVKVGPLLRVSLDFDPESPGWGQDRFDSIQNAIDAASAEESSKILVEPGVYFETIDTSGKPVILTGTDPMDSDTVISTVLDAWRAGGENSGPAVRIADGEDNRTQVRGFTIRYATGGSGIEIQNSAPIIEYNRILGNSSGEGGGIYARRIQGSSQDKLLIQQNQISGNFAAGRGGGVHLYLIDSEALLSNNVIYANTAEDEGGGIFSQVEGPIAGLVIDGNRIERNAAPRGGGVSLMASGWRETVLNGNLIVANISGVEGGGVFISRGNLFRIEHCVIHGNQSPDYPVLVAYDGRGHSDGGVFLNNIVSQNRTSSNIPAHGYPEEQALMVINGLDVRFNNFWNNRLDVRGNERIPYGENGNTAFDPFFADADSGDFRLQSHVGRWDPGLGDWVVDEEHSPLIAAGAPRPDGTRPNMGAYGLSETASLPLDKPMVSISTTWPGYLSKVNGLPTRVVMARSGLLDDALSVTVDVSGDAEQGSDYSLSGEMSDFNSGEASKFVTLTPVASEAISSPRTIVYSLEGEESFLSGSQSEAVIPIYDHPYNDWVVENIDEQEWMDISVSGPLSVRDDSRLSNLHYAAFAMDGSVPSQRHLPEAMAFGTLRGEMDHPLEAGPLIRFTRPVHHDGLVYSLDVAESLGEWWEPVPSRVITIDPNPDGRTETVTITWNDDPQGIIPPWFKEADSLFFRIRVRLTGESVLFPSP